MWPPISSFALDFIPSPIKFFGVQLHVPPPPHCTDNGVMIAWAGMERLKALEAGRYEPWVQEDCMDEGDGCVLGREGAVSD